MREMPRVSSCRDSCAGRKSLVSPPVAIYCSPISDHRTRMAATPLELLSRTDSARLCQWTEFEPLRPPLQTKPLNSFDVDRSDRPARWNSVHPPLDPRDNPAALTGAGDGLECRSRRTAMR